MWGFEGGDSKVVRIEFTNRVRRSDIGLGLANLLKTGKVDIPSDNKDYTAHFAKQWTFNQYSDFGFMQGKWKFIRQGLHRNKTYEFRP